MSKVKPRIVRPGFQPRKRLGQHFLKDKGIIHDIINRARFGQSDEVLEVGPGLGALTLPLARSVFHLSAVEKDPRLVDRLWTTLSREGIRNVNLVNEDILKLDFHKIQSDSGKKMKIIGNLPYNISSPFLEKLIENRALVSRAILMFQLELARRLVARPHGRDYGAMSVLTQYHANVVRVLAVPKEAFYPRPKVDSMVLELDFQRPHPRRAEDDVKFKIVVRKAFAHRRKTLLNSLKGSLPSSPGEEILAALETCHIDPQRRAETLDIDDFLCLSLALGSLA